MIKLPFQIRQSVQDAGSVANERVEERGVRARSFGHRPRMDSRGAAAVFRIAIEPRGLSGCDWAMRSSTRPGGSPSLRVDATAFRPWASLSRRAADGSVNSR